MRVLASFLVSAFAALILNNYYSGPLNVTAQSRPNPKIAFTSGGFGNTSSEIYVINSDGIGQTKLTDNGSDDRFPAWSPDGSQIIFESTRQGSTYNILKMIANEQIC